ncbi:hypothetical protein IGJ48_000181 [Enterococcus pernyi]
MLNQTTTDSTNEFRKKLDLLALSLSLQENINHFGLNKDYQLLFSTYIQMIHEDQDEFFIKQSQKENIIESLKRTKDFYDFEKKEQVQMIFEKLRNNDPTDFMLIPSSFYPGEYGKVSPHACGLTVYKKNDSFVVMKVDKEKRFDDHTVSYFEIPPTNIAELSEVFLKERFHEVRKPYYVLKRLTALSTQNESIGIPTIVMKGQTTENCAVTEIEASLRTILFNCRKDIFSLDKDIKVTPKWHSKHPAPTSEMRKRFVDAMEGEDIAQNENLKYILHHYQYRKGELVENPASGIILSSHGWYRKIRKHYSEDPYISIMLDNNGHIPDTYDKSKIKEKSKFIEPPGLLYNTSIQKADKFELGWAQSQITYEIKLYKERLPHINIKAAKEVTEYLVTQLEEKHKEIEVELQKRLETKVMSDKEEIKQRVIVNDEGGTVYIEKKLDTITSEIQNDTSEEKWRSFKALKEHAVTQATMKRKTLPYEDIRAVEKIEKLSSGRCRINKTGCFSFLRTWKNSSLKRCIPEQENTKKVKFSDLFQRLRLNQKRTVSTGHTTSRQQPLVSR